MHYVFGLRGKKADVDETIKFLETRTFMLPIKKKDGTLIQQPISSLLQPIQLYSFVFPEHHRDLVLNSLGATKERKDRWWNNPKMKLMNETLRIALGCQKIPKKFDTSKKMPMPYDSAMKNVAIYPIGLRKDYYGETPSGYHELI